MTIRRVWALEIETHVKIDNQDAGNVLILLFPTPYGGFIAQIQFQYGLGNRTYFIDSLDEIKDMVKQAIKDIRQSVGVNPPNNVEVEILRVSNFYVGYLNQIRHGRQKPLEPLNDITVKS